MRLRSKVRIRPRISTKQCLFSHLLDIAKVTSSYEKKYGAFDQVLERLRYDSDRAEYFVLLLSILCLDRAFILQVMKCSGGRLVHVALECATSKMSHPQLKLHALTLLCTIRPENTLENAIAFILEEGEQLGVDLLHGLRVAI